MTRDGFERRYPAMPHVKKAELIEGVVYMGSPVRHPHHGRPARVIGTWPGYHEIVTPGLDASSNATVRLDVHNMPQPDLLLRLTERVGGRSHVTADGHLEGPPELVIEIAASSTSCDLHEKAHACRRNSAQEYLVHRVEDGEVD